MDTNFRPKNRDNKVTDVMDPCLAMSEADLVEDTDYGKYTGATSKEDQAEVSAASMNILALAH